MTTLERKMKRTTKKLVDHLGRAPEAIKSNQSKRVSGRTFILQLGLKKDMDLCLKATELKHNISTKINETSHAHKHSKRSYAVPNA
jgi:hypothetical protein